MERGPTEDSCFLTQTSVGTRSLGLEALAKGAVTPTTPEERGPTEPSTLAGMYPALHHHESFNLQNECRAALAAAKSHA